MCSTCPRKAENSPRKSRNSSAKCSKERWFSFISIQKVNFALLRDALADRDCKCEGAAADPNLRNGGRGRDRTGDPLLAKQVLSQLSYTPTVGVTSILKHFRRFQNPFLRLSILWSELRFERVLVCSSRVSVRNENPISAPDRFAQKLNFKPN